MTFTIIVKKNSCFYLELDHLKRAGTEHFNKQTLRYKEPNSAGNEKRITYAGKQNTQFLKKTWQLLKIRLSRMRPKKQDHSRSCFYSEIQLDPWTEVCGLREGFLFMSDEGWTNHWEKEGANVPSCRRPSSRNAAISSPTSWVTGATKGQTMKSGSESIDQ